MDIRYYYLENQEGTSYKFYLAASGEDGTIYLRWGKIGTKGQEQVYSTIFDVALSEVRDKVHSKIRKGYRLLVEDLMLKVEPGMEWSDAFFNQHAGTSPAQAPKPIVSCCTCGTGGWDLAGWRKRDNGVECYDCQTKAVRA